MPCYPNDLAPLPSSANFSEMETSGLIMEFEFLRGTGLEINKTIISQGTNEQCFHDSCLELLESAVDRCENQSAYHYVFSDNCQVNGTHTTMVASTM